MAETSNASAGSGKRRSQHSNDRAAVPAAAWTLRGHGRAAGPQPIGRQDGVARDTVIADPWQDTRLARLT